LHLVVGVLKSLLLLLLLAGAVVLYVGEWMTGAHSEREEEIKNFTQQQTIYRVNTATDAISVAKAGEFAVDKDTFNAVFTGCEGTDTSLKHTTWFDHDWLNEKSDLFELAYIVASRNIAALRYAISEVRRGVDLTSFRNACGEADPRFVKIPNAPVVNIAFIRQTDRDLESPANAHLNHFTGMCLASSNCTDADYLPRNDNIYADALYHQVTPNQDAALKALYATGTPEFWIAAAHANGINNDVLIGELARRNQAEQADALQHLPTYQEQFEHEAEIAIVCCLLFFGGIVWLVRRARN
jgi:hypothetical protein